MVLAIGVPALARIDDVSPPAWGGITPRCTFVWQIDTEFETVPSCANYDPPVEDPNVYWAEAYPQTGHPVGTWTPDPCNGTYTVDGKHVYINVRIPPGAVGDYPNMTIRIQIGLVGEEEEWSWSMTEVWSKHRDEPRMEGGCDFEEFEETGVHVAEYTFEDIPEQIDRIGVILEDATFTMTGLIIDVLRHPGPAPTSSPGRVICDDSPVLPVVVDPNVMLVYETDETQGDFDVSLLRPPFGGTVTIVVDPNGYGGWGEGQDEDKDIELLAGVGPDNQVTLTFDAGNWDIPQTVLFKALNDTMPEPPELLEATEIILKVSHPTDANFVGEKSVVVNVMDNDQANILFRATPMRGGTRVRVTGPVELWERLTASDKIRWRKIGIQLQVRPLIDKDPCSPTEVKLRAEVTGPIVDEVIGTIKGNNLPLTDPCLPFQDADDPNCFTYTATTSSNGLGTGCPDHDPANRTTCWNVDLDVKIWGSDDEVLQVLDFDTYPEFEDEQYYQATLVVTVVDGGGDERYWRQEPVLDEWGVPTGEIVTIRLEKSVEFDIEDNECGAFGVLEMDIGNSDPCAVDNKGNPLPDCYVNIHDVVEMAKRWLNCSDPQGTGCAKPL